METPHHGRWFEDLPVGLVVPHALTRTITETDNVLFTTMTLNPARLHLDAEYAAGTEFGQPLVNSLFTARAPRRASRCSRRPTAPRSPTSASTRSSFPAPMFVGDTLHGESEVVASRESKSRPDAGHRHVRAPRRSTSATSSCAGPAATRSCTTRPAGRERRARRRAPPQPAVRAREQARRARASCRASGPTASCSTSRTRCRPTASPLPGALPRRRRRARPRRTRELAVYVRVNPVPTEWFAADVADGVAPELAGIIVPKLESPEQLDDGRRRADARRARAPARRSPGSRARSESTERESSSAPPVAVAYFGAEDFVADMGGVRTESSTEVLYAAVPGRARRRGSPVCTRSTRWSRRLDDEDRFLADAAAGPCPRIPGQAVHPPGTGPARQPRVLAVTRGARPGPPAPRRVRRRRPHGAKPRSTSRARWSTSRSPATRAPCSRLQASRPIRAEQTVAVRSVESRHAHPGRARRRPRGTPPTARGRARRGVVGVEHQVVARSRRRVAPPPSSPGGSSSPTPTRSRRVRGRPRRHRCRRRPARRAGSSTCCTTRSCRTRCRPTSDGRSSSSRPASSRRSTTSAARSTGAGSTTTRSPRSSARATTLAARRAAWEASKQIGPEVAERIRELARLRNRAARELGYRDHFALALATGELDEERLFATLDDVDRATAAPFAAWKARARRSRSPGDSGARPTSSGRGISTTRSSRARRRRARSSLDHLFVDADLEALTLRTYDGLGLDVRPVLEHSDLYARDGKSQHAFCIDIDRAGDVRVLCNVEPSERWMDTMLHEFGHAIYDRECDTTLPWLLRGATHALTTEGIAMLMGRLPRDPEWLRDVAAVDRRAHRRRAGTAARGRAAALRSSCSRAGCSS